ncbi:DEKNAAC100635 [Brettanomyces naardenensis]|uniref:DEKNAAC100635 n=1 Tax=Brettanomyces naardenensis TaxID=13370 RepID=A0A448YGL6_BRENA|nr:DEKNAAC100635 [Brettanomyces naardenensis]
MVSVRRSSSVRSSDSAFSQQNARLPEKVEESILVRLEHLTSILLILFERVITTITFILPRSVISLFTSVVRFILNLYTTNDTPYKKLISQEETALNEDWYLRRVESLRTAQTFDDLCYLNGFVSENHMVMTKDNYSLTLHRLNPEDNGFKSNGKVVFLQHGLLMSSEVWCVRVNKDDNIPFRLCELGYDVFLGNNRGNKYSCKQRDLNVKDRKFWDFSIDEFAVYDMPACVDYVLNFKKASSLTFIAFSQGCSQILASLSINRELNEKIDKLILIAPATTPKRLSNWLINSIVHFQPKMMFFLFGRKILMESISRWCGIVYPPFFVKLIDIPNSILFDWQGRNIDVLQKLVSYFHLYSTTSVKCVVHWFQIIRSNKFQMYQDSTLFDPFEYPIHVAMRVPEVLLIYGMSDSLVDIDVMLDQLPSFDSVKVDYVKDGPEDTAETTIGEKKLQQLKEEDGSPAFVPEPDTDNVKVNETRVTSSEETENRSKLHIIGVENYEHLDLIWGRNIQTAIIRNMLDFLGE